MNENVTLILTPVQQENEYVFPESSELRIHEKRQILLWGLESLRKELSRTTFNERYSAKYQSAMYLLNGFIKDTEEDQEHELWLVSKSELLEELSQMF